MHTIHTPAYQSGDHTQLLQTGTPVRPVFDFQRQELKNGSLHVYWSRRENRHRNERFPIPKFDIPTYRTHTLTKRLLPLVDVSTHVCFDAAQDEYGTRELWDAKGEQDLRQMAQWVRALTEVG